jgi:hypothetical protein
MKNIRFFVVTLIATLFAACTDDNVQQIENIKDVELLDGNILKFKDQATFDRYVSEGIKAPEGFYSIYQNFDEAMSEAESYYDREGGYEEFKQKYASLYFPEYKDDYSAYLPVSEDAKAKFLNLNGEVYIKDELKNFKDVDTYEKLMELGKGMARYDVKTKRKAEGTDPGTGLPLNGLNCIYYNDRELWVNTDYNGSIATSPAIHIEICFRKKGFLGAWYNYSSESFFGCDKTDVSSYPDFSSGNIRPGDGYSSHDHYILRAAQIRSAKVWVSFRGFGETHGFDKFYFILRR